MVAYGQRRQVLQKAPPEVEGPGISTRSKRSNTKATDLAHQNRVERVRRFTMSTLCRSLAKDLREKHIAIDPEFVFPVFAEAATAGDRKAAYMRFMKFLEDTELDTLYKSKHRME